MSKLNTIDGSMEWPDGKRLKKNFDYADDVCLFAKTIEQIKMTTELVVVEANKVRQKINTRKTVIIRIRTFAALVTSA